MSSLQKFHRRTLSIGGNIPILGSGSNIKGYYLGISGDGTSYMYVAPKTTETRLAWGSYNIVRGTTSVTNGLANTNTLYSFGSVAHPAAYYCKSLTTGGYNTWYMPAKNELITCWSNHLATPFSTNDAFMQVYYNSSTESTATQFWSTTFYNGLTQVQYIKDDQYGGYLRAVRRSLT